MLLDIFKKPLVKLKLVKANVVDTIFSPSLPLIKEISGKQAELDQLDFLFLKQL